MPASRFSWSSSCFRVFLVASLLLVVAACSRSQVSTNASAAPAKPKLGIRPQGDTEIQPDMSKITNDDLKKVFTDANPLFGHAEMALWVATQGGRDIGRIAGVLDQNHNRAQKDNAAFFGFFPANASGPSIRG